MKKIITVTAAALLVGSLAACGDPAPSSPPPAPIVGADCDWEFDDGQWECEDDDSGMIWFMPLGGISPSKSSINTYRQQRKSSTTYKSGTTYKSRTTTSYRSPSRVGKR